MSVQQVQQLYHANPLAEESQIHSNGVHSTPSHPHAAQATNGHNSAGMNPYQQHPQYPGGYGAPPPQQQQQQPQRHYSNNNQLPPMYAPMQQQPMAAHYPSYQGYPPPSFWASAPPGSQPALTPAPPAQPQERQLSESRIDQSGRYQYSLRVEQQPLRARMCGFGDKDRRPITPPPCIRLIIMDLQTGKEADLEQSEGMFYVLQVDLWSEDASKEVNIVRSSSSSPAVSISTATTTSYPPPPERHPALHQYHGPEGPRWMYDAMPSLTGGPPIPQMPYQPGMPPVNVPPGYTTQAPSSSNTTMFTRNLIGSLTVNAAFLKDDKGKEGFWFVLQDLSVRTEGFFRLRMNFIDVKDPNGPGPNRNRAPCLAWTFSDPFQVFSAKKFPGVIESTPLSKTFASQGIKIPIRKDVKSERDGEEGDEE